MDPLISKRLKTKIVVHPYIGTKRGDKIYGYPYILFGYVNYREKIERNTNGTDTNNYTAVIFNGQEIPDSIKDKVIGFRDNSGEIVPLIWNGEFFILKADSETPIQKRDNEISGILVTAGGREFQYANVKPDDEIELPGQGRVPIKVVKSYQGLTRGTQNIEAVI